MGFRFYEMPLSGKNRVSEMSKPAMLTSTFGSSHWLSCTQSSCLRTQAGLKGTKTLKVCFFNQPPHPLSMKGLEVWGDSFLPHLISF